MKKQIIVLSILTLIISFGLFSFTTKETSELVPQTVCHTIYTPGNYGVCSPLTDDPILKKVYDQMDLLLQQNPPNSVAANPTYEVWYNCETGDIYYYIIILS